MKKIFFLIILVLFTSFIYCQTRSDYINDEVIVKIKKNINPDELIDDFSKLFDKNISNVNIISIAPVFPYITSDETDDKLDIDLSRIYRIKYSPDYDAKIIAKILMSSNTLEYAEPYYIPQLLYIPDDPYKNNQYYLNLIQAYDAWDIEQGDSNIVIGIVDTGFDFSHPDLVNAVAYNYRDTIDGIDNDNDGFVDNYYGWDFGEMDNDPTYVSNAHGVHISGIAGATTDNNFGMSGIGFNCKVLPIKVINDNDQMIYTYEGIIYAVEHGCRVVNCSWGSSTFPGQFPLEVTKYATLVKKAIIVAAAGNQNNEIRYFPASLPYVVSVAATNQYDTKWSNSSYYYGIDISAPGSNIFSTWPNTGFIYSNGTSMAAPMVSAAAALVFSHYPQLNNLDAIELLRTTADKIDTISSNLIYKNKLGSGRLNIYNALSDTFIPSIRLLDYSNFPATITTGDTLILHFTIQSFLKTSYDVVIHLQSQNPNFRILDSIFIFDSLSYNIPKYLSARFIIDDTTYTPTTFLILAKLSNSSFTNVDPIYLDYSPNIIDLTNDNLLASFTNNGRIGYYDGRYHMYGNGVKYKNSYPLSSTIGIIAATADGRISDNIYGASDQLKNSFKVKNEIYSYINNSNFTRNIVCSYNDSLSFLPIGIDIRQNSYCYIAGIDQDFFIIDYKIKNIAYDNIEDFYFGIYADWDIGDKGNKTIKENSIRGAITFDIDSNYFAGIGLLTDLPYSIYALDNNGADGSINIYDGFTDVEKKMCITSERNMAGNQSYGNDVSVLVKTGPLSINFLDSLQLSFIFVFSKNYHQLINNYQSALSIYNNINNSDLFLTQEPIIYPNPAINEVNIQLPDNNGIISIFDEKGSLVLTKKITNDFEKISTQDFTTGIYLVIIKTKEQEWKTKLFIH
jgi:subtilisin family serine protease